MRRWRERICARGRRDRHAERGDPAAGHAAPTRSSSSNGAPTPTASGPARRGPLPVRAAARRGRGVRRRVPQLARRRSTWSRRCASCAPAACTGLSAVLIGDGPELAARPGGGRRDSPASCFTGAVPHDAMPACLAAADIGVAPFDLGRARPARARLLLVAAEDLRVHGRGPAGRRAGDCRASPRSSAHDGEGVLYDPARAGGARRRARARCCDPPRRAAASAPPRASARVRDYSWAAHCEALDAALRRAQDAGAHERPDRHRRVPAGLRRQRVEHLRARARPARARARACWSCSRGRARRRPCARRRTTASRCIEFGAAAPPLPYVRNYFKNERLHARLADFLTDADPARADRHRPRPARDDVPAGDRRGAAAPACRRCAPCATTGRSATGRT